jgi:hypothetical protein
VLGLVIHDKLHRSFEIHDRNDCNTGVRRRLPAWSTR